MLTVIIIIYLKVLKNLTLLIWRPSLGLIYLVRSTYLKPTFHLFLVFQIKVFQQISSSKFCKHSPNHYINKTASLTMEALHYLVIAISASNISSLMTVKHEQWFQLVQLCFMPGVSKVKLLQELAATKQSAQRVRELLFLCRSSCSQERWGTREMQWDMSSLWWAQFIYKTHENSVPTLQ
jgi:hypothetical protein